MRTAGARVTAPEEQNGSHEARAQGPASAGGGGTPVGEASMEPVTAPGTELGGERVSDASALTSRPADVLWQPDGRGGSCSHGVPRLSLPDDQPHESWTPQ